LINRKFEDRGSDATPLKNKVEKPIQQANNLKALFTVQGQCRSTKPPFLVNRKFEDRGSDATPLKNKVEKRMQQANDLKNLQRSYIE